MFILNLTHVSHNSIQSGQYLLSDIICMSVCDWVRLLIKIILLLLYYYSKGFMEESSQAFVYGPGDPQMDHVSHKYGNKTKWEKHANGRLPVICI